MIECKENLTFKVQLDFALAIKDKSYVWPDYISSPGITKLTPQVPQGNSISNSGIRGDLPKLYNVNTHK